MRDSIKGAIALKAEEIAARFKAVALEELAQDRVHWIVVGGDPDQTISDYAKLFDFTILGQFENLVEADELELHPDRIAYESGRPVLIIPRDYQQSDFNEKAVLAWDGNRTATHALADALQVLQTKDQVTVLTVESAGLGKPLPGIDITSVLERHGIPTDRRTVSPGGKTVGQTIMEHCSEIGAGLLVMGAYERSKIGQDLTSGVTNEIFKHTKIPVLMSH